jgi:hypothetical protein
MTFLEAAIELLRQAGAPLTVEELTSRAVSQGLLTNAGRDPAHTMEARLAQEVRKGPHTLLVKLPSGEYGLRRYDKPRIGANGHAEAPASVAAVAETIAPGPEAEPEAEAEAEAAPEAEAEAAPEAEAAAEAGAKKKRRGRRGGRGRSKKKPGEVAAAAEPTAVEVSADTAALLDSEPEAGTPEEAIVAAALAEEAEREAALEAVEDAARRAEEARAAAGDHEETDEIVAELPPVYEPPPSAEPNVDIDAFLPPVRSRRGLIDLPDEAALAAEYGDELGSGTVIRPVEGEVVDEHTADEDRPMLEEITAQDTRDRERRDRRRGRGRDRDRGRERGRPEAQRAAPAPAPVPAAAPAGTPPQPQPAAPPGGAPPSVGLADAAWQLLRSIGDGRPVHARQLAAMAHKRRLAAGEPEDIARALKAALLDDARSRQARGLRPRVRHAGGGAFALTTARLEPELAGLEEAVAGKAEALARETRSALRRRLVKLPITALEHVARLLLERQGYTELERVKRVDNTTYLAARRKRGGIVTRVLVGVRAGGDEGGRRAVGELRAGVQAKQLDEGLLLLCTRLGGEGERELRQVGPHVEAYDGDAFAEALLVAGVGVLRVTMPIAYLDSDFFSELVEW